MKLYLRLLQESFKFAWQAIVANKLRTFLSLLGVMVGIFLISMVFTASDSMESSLRDSFSMVNDDVVFVNKWPWGPEGEGEYQWWEYFQRRQPSENDMEDLRDRLETAKAVSYQTGDIGNAEFRGNVRENVQIAGVSVDYEKCVEINIDKGRYFTDIELNTGRPLVVIGQEITDMLFPNGDPIGKELKLKGLKVEIIGTFEREGTSLIGNGFDELAVIPAPFASRIINVKQVDSSILVKAKEGVSNEELKDEIVQHFRSIRKINPRDKNDFSINEMGMLSGFIDGIFGTVEIGTWFIGLFAILVGCFSIANIMFVSVRERTKIIGIQKALGAKKMFILGQFLFEAVALCIFGALMAFGLIVLITFIVNAIDIGIQLEVSAYRFLMAMTIAVVSGIIAGIFPAAKASALDPVEAMRGK
ncbi:MAG: ABC transporter permease [Flavobacteriales bacterium]|nr:ABC transporter permease [Flavobacteriales bacterium]